MKLALVRTASNQLRFGSYNIQEIGLARSILSFGVSTDIYARFSNLIEEQVVEEYNGAKVTIIPLKGRRIFKEIMYYPKLKSQLCKGEYNVVQLLDESQMMLPYLFKALKKRGVKTILWQGMYRNFSGRVARVMQVVYDKLFVDTINKHSDFKIAKTHYAAEYLKNKKYDTVNVLPVGLNHIDSEIDTKLLDEVECFKKNHSRLLFYIGAIERRRDIPFLLLVLSQLKKEGYGLVLVGSGPDSDLVDQMINNRGLNNDVLRYKNIANNKIANIFPYIQCLVLPTQYEIYGMVMLEALINGVPVVATPEAGPCTILENDELGTCVPFNTNKWIEVIKFYEGNYSGEESKSRRKKQVMDKYNWEAIGKEYFHKYLSNLSRQALV
ncbi:glycosyltransferase family 1 protein [Marinilabiliaceae bacterium JC017]|nr:glycosyltransferase family 1 protein [Marinilabiliaceae bacterium JC017]